VPCCPTSADSTTTGKPCINLESCLAVCLVQPQAALTCRKAQVLPLLQPHFFPFTSATLLLLLAWPEQAAAVFQVSCAGLTAFPSTLKAQLAESCQPHSLPLSS
jgi:hypothetical protein